MWIQRNVKPQHNQELQSPLLSTPRFTRRKSVWEIAGKGSQMKDTHCVKNLKQPKSLIWQSSVQYLGRNFPLSIIGYLFYLQVSWKEVLSLKKVHSNQRKRNILSSSGIKVMTFMENHASSRFGWAQRMPCVTREDPD